MKVRFVKNSYFCVSVFLQISAFPMTTYIAQFSARHRLIQVRQQSIFIWQQESGEIDRELLSGKIKREASQHFYRLLGGDSLEILLEDIDVQVEKTAPFNG